MRIAEIPTADAPMDLLLLADPSMEKIRSYLPRARCFVATVDGERVGACVVERTGHAVYELMTIAVAPARQQGGMGAQLLKQKTAYEIS